MPSLPYVQLLAGNVTDALVTAWDALPYSLFWIMIGILIFGVVHTKTRSYGVSGLITILYFVVASPMIHQEIMVYIALLLGILGVVMFLKIWKG